MYIVTAEEMYKVDRETTGTIGLDAKILMENAGREASREIEKRISKEDRAVILIGGGNNGGDGFVIARVLSEAGYPVKAIQVAPDEKITGDAAYEFLFSLLSSLTNHHGKAISFIFNRI